MKNPVRYSAEREHRGAAENSENTLAPSSGNLALEEAEPSLQPAMVDLQQWSAEVCFFRW